ncbi:MAG: hypothetical protein CR988_00545 [Treponema sp.]|nr:MAG: hypothetical protein CR988_00545 [Treponema sp.]
MKIISEIEEQVLKEVYPQLSLTEDFDIERYFELRKLGRMSDAIALYNSRLRKKYPDDEMRVQLLSFYRSKDSRFGILLTENLSNLAMKTIEQFKRVIEYITDKTIPLEKNDVFGIIQACESLVSSMSKDRFVAIGQTEKYARLANIIGFRVKEMREAAELIRLYVTDSLSSVRAFRTEQAENKRLERERQKFAPKPVFDFSKINFTKDQKDAILLPSGIQRVEDKVIGYLIKYWHHVFDGVFENLVLMYSRKYKTEHYSIFMTIKTARVRNWQDDEILHSVLSNVVSGYYYSISGDVYLHQNWLKVKQSLLTAPDKTGLSLLPERKRLIVKAPPLLITDTSKRQNPKAAVSSAKTKPASKTSSTKSVASKKDFSTNAEKLSKISMDEKKKSQEKYAQLKREEAQWRKTASKTMSSNAKKYADQQRAFLESQKRGALKKSSSQSELPKPKSLSPKKPSLQKQTQKEQIQKKKLEARNLVKIQREKEEKARKLAVEARLAEKAKDREIKRKAKEKAKQEELRKKNLAKQAQRALQNKQSEKNAEEKKFAKKIQEKKRLATLEKRKRLTASKKSASKRGAPKSPTVKKPNIFIPQKTGYIDTRKTRSIEQMIKRATGKTYVAYKDVFFKSIRHSIRYILEHSSGHKPSMFKSEQNMAENIIYVFLERNYDNPYQNWQESNAKQEVEQLGFKVDNLNIIIKHWVKTKLH